MDLQGANLPTPRFRTGPLPPELSRVQGYKNLQTFFPTLTKLFRLGKWNPGQEIWMDNHWKILGIDCSGTTGPCCISVCKNCDVSGTPDIVPLFPRKAFLKTTHLLDPVQWIRGEYSLPKHNGLPWHRKAWQKAWEKLQDPGNKAYVETVAAYAVGRLREEGLTPHFPIFYGAFCAQADIYRYNLTDDFQSYRHERWFWKGYHKGLFKFQILNNDTATSESGMLDELLKAYETVGESNSSESESESELEELSVYKCSGREADGASIQSADSMSGASFAEESTETGSEHESSSESNNSDESDELTYTIYAEFENYPVMLILMEQSEGTMDSLFDNTEAVGAEPGTPEWEARWSAWIFQIIAGLSCVQTMLGFTHNDLHTNNIVWAETDEKYLYYKSRAGAIFRVPTYGKIFRIIDYGRSIFRINKQLFISDDFRPGNDAAEQYYFKPLVHKFDTEVKPNPSFDLCRLAVSMIDGIFPKTPEKKEGGAVLSDEPGLRVDETVSKLYNLVWSWMIDDEGRNIFIEPDGSERFPDFDLYKHIARYVHKAIPAQQIQSPAFDGFQVAENEIPSGQKVYSLFY